jgi:DNA-directed RNA polymerase specialized sigma24 family protein
MSVSQIAPEDLVEDFEWPEPDAPRSPYMTKAQGKEQARNLYLTELAEVTQAINGLKDRRPEIVRLAKVNGATWEEIGEALGTSRQAACRTYND